MATFKLFAASITSLSLIDPPGWTSAVAPAAWATSRVSGKGRKASDATPDPLSGERDFSMAILAASTLLIWPAPIPIVLSGIGENDRIAAGMFADLPGQPQRLHFGCRRIAVSYGLPVFLVVRCPLEEQSAVNRSHLVTAGPCGKDQDPHGFFGFHDPGSFRGKRRRRNYFHECRGNFFRQCCIHFTVDRNNRTVCRNRIVSRALIYAFRILSPTATPHGLLCLTITAQGSSNSASRPDAASRSR